MKKIDTRNAPSHLACGMVGASDPRPPGFGLFLAGGGVLACCAGATNAQMVLCGLHLPTTHMTGSLTTLPAHLVLWNGLQVGALVALVASFFAGAAFSGAVIESTELRLGRRYGLLLLAAGFLLAMGAYQVGRGAFVVGGALTASGAGIQNGMATRVSAAIVRTTHMTGVVTDLGIALGKAIAGRGVSRWRVLLHVSLLGGFTAGGLLGALLNLRVGVTGLYVPAFFVSVLGFGYGVWRRQRYEVRVVEFPRG